MLFFDIGGNMKEARLITIWSILLSILATIIIVTLHLLYPGAFDYIGILTNIYCGVIVGLVTSICQYFIQKRRIINTVYSAYFDVYRTYYYAKNKHFLFHYNTLSVYKKLADLNPKIVDALDEYHGFFKEYDKMYKKLNPQIELGEHFKMSNILKSTFSWFNKKKFDSILEPLMNDIEKILKVINYKRFEKDKESMVKMFNYIYDKD